MGAATTIRSTQETIGRHSKDQQTWWRRRPSTRRTDCLAAPSNETCSTAGLKITAECPNGGACVLRVGNTKVRIGEEINFDKTLLTNGSSRDCSRHPRSTSRPPRTGSGDLSVFVLEQCDLAPPLPTILGRIRVLQPKSWQKLHSADKGGRQPDFPTLDRGILPCIGRPTVDETKL